MPALEAGAVEVDLARLARAVAGRDGRRAVGRAATDLVDAHLALEGVRQADDDHAVMQEHRQRGEYGRLLAAVLGGRGGEDRADLADELSLRPQTAGLVEEVL